MKVGEIHVELLLDGAVVPGVKPILHHSNRKTTISLSGSVELRLPKTGGKLTVKVVRDSGTETYTVKQETSYLRVAQVRER